MDILEVRNLCKRYPAFELKNVSFSLEEGKITGFIGRNGAGKTTTLKSIFNFVHPDGGEIRFFGKSFSENQAEGRLSFRRGRLLPEENAEDDHFHHEIVLPRVG